MIGSRGRRLVATLAAAGYGIAIAAATAGSVAAWDDEIVKNCSDDYFAYCSAHDPDSKDVRLCMEANRDKLSKQCLKAIFDGGQVPRSYLSQAPNGASGGQRK